MYIEFFEFFLHLMHLDRRVPDAMYTEKSVGLEEIFGDQKLCRLA